MHLWDVCVHSCCVCLHVHAHKSYSCDCAEVKELSVALFTAQYPHLVAQIERYIIPSNKVTLVEPKKDPHPIILPAGGLLMTPASSNYTCVIYMIGILGLINSKDCSDS